jgi:hypothetical protein
MLDEIGRHLKLYHAMLIVCLESLIKIFHAKFIFYSFVALAIGTIGVWAPVVFELDLNKSDLLQDEVYEVILLNESKPSGLIDETVSIKADVVKQSLIEITKVVSSREIGIENFSIFMYVLGILGILAAEYFIKERKIDTEVQGAILTFCMFVWFLALVLAFWALKDPKNFTWQLGVSFWLSVSLWLSYTVSNADFNGDIESAKSKLSGTEMSVGSEFGGEGIK